MRILITTDWYKPVINGVVTSIINIENEFRRQGHEVRILTLSQSMMSYREGNVTYIASLSAGTIYPNARVRLLCNQKWIKEIIEWKPDIVHSQCEFSSFGLAKKIADTLGVPLIHTYHTIYEDYTHYFSPNRKMGKKAAEIFSRRICNQADEIIVPTEKVAQLLEKYKVQSPISIAPSGIEIHESDKETRKDALRRELHIPENIPVLLYLGRLAKEKNVEELFENLKNYEGKELLLLIVGDGPDRKEIQAAACKLPSHVSVAFTGMVPGAETWKYYQAADLFVSASRSETQGLTYVEACAAGLILLCKKDDCLKHVIEREQNGWQYDSADEFRKALTRYLELSEDTKKSMSEYSRRIGERYSIEHTARTIKKVYVKAMNNLYKSVGASALSEERCHITSLKEGV